MLNKHHEITKKMLKGQRCTSCKYNLIFDPNSKIKYHCSRKIFKPKYNVCNYYIYSERHSFGYPLFIRYIYRVTVKFQKLLHLMGFAWHNLLFNECTPDFNCCCHGIGRFHFNKSRDYYRSKKRIN